MSYDTCAVNNSTEVNLYTVKGISVYLHVFLLFSVRETTSKTFSLLYWAIKPLKRDLLSKVGIGSQGANSSL